MNSDISCDTDIDTDNDGVRQQVKTGTDRDRHCDTVSSDHCVNDAVTVCDLDCDGDVSAATALISLHAWWCCYQLWHGRWHRLWHGQCQQQQLWHGLSWQHIACFFCGVNTFCNDLDGDNRVKFDFLQVVKVDVGNAPNTSFIDTADIDSTDCVLLSADTDTASGSVKQTDKHAADMDNAGDMGWTGRGNSLYCESVWFDGLDLLCACSKQTQTQTVAVPSRPMTLTETGTWTLPYSTGRGLTSVIDSPGVVDLRFVNGTVTRTEPIVDIDCDFDCHDSYSLTSELCQKQPLCVTAMGREGLSTPLTLFKASYYSAQKLLARMNLMHPCVANLMFRHRCILAILLIMH